jgi:hypothetical protein
MPSLRPTVPEHCPEPDQSASSDAKLGPQRNKNQYGVDAMLGAISSSHGPEVTISAQEQIQQAKGFMTERDKLFNLPKFQELEKNVFPPRPEVESLLQDTHIIQVPYRKMWPRNCTDEVIKLAEANGAPIHTTLNMFIRIPKVLLKATKPTKLEIWLDLHGGGGSSLGCSKPYYNTSYKRRT